MGSFEVYSKTQTVKTIRAEIILKDPLVEQEIPTLGRDFVEVRDEVCIGTGPTSSRIVVIDYNGSLDQVFKGAELHSSKVRFKIGRQPLETDFNFHQVNVWAIIHKTLELLENPDVFGRRIPWAFEGGRLKVLPHAGYWENAYYDRETGALHFFYFEGRNSGQPIFTCLSHDIVTHELGHAVLDGLKPYYNEVSSVATAGFHEYFGDAVALTASLDHRKVIVEIAGRQDSVLTAKSLLANIGQQFGQGLADEYGSIADAYLRTAQNNWTMDDLVGVYEEHDYSKVMTGAYYDLLERVYKYLISGKNARKANDRVAALYNAARVVRRMMLRAIDYCPPVDVSYFDYAQAVFRADKMAYPIDIRNYRDMWVRVAKGRRIVKNPKDLNPSRTIYNSHLRNLYIDSLAASTTDAYVFIDANRTALGLSPTASFEVINLYRTKKVSSDDYRVPQEIIIEFVWASEIKLTGREFGPLRNSFLPLWCGGTLVFNRDGNLLHYTVKRDDQLRRHHLSKYARYLMRQGYLAIDDGERGLGAAASGRYKITARIEDGRVSLSRNAAKRHFHEDGKGGGRHG